MSSRGSRRTRRRPRLALAAAVLAVATCGAGAVAPGALASPAPHGGGGRHAPVVVSVTPDQRLDNAWRRFGNTGGGWHNRGGWAAADGTYSTRLPGGRIAWLFNDTFLGPVNPDESLPAGAGFVHNSIVLAGRDGLPQTTLTGGTRQKPESLVGATPTKPPWDPDGTNDRWYWNTDGIVDGGKLRVFELAQAPSDDEPPFNFQWVGTDIATFSHDLRSARVTPSYDEGNVQWGVELIRHGGYIYIYGVEGVPFNKYMHIARARVGHLVERSWEFYTGSGWSRDPTASARVLDDVGSSYGVTPVDGHFVLTTSNATLGHEVYVATAPSPTGPFTNRKAVYTAPEGGGNIYAPYNIAAHPDLSRRGELVISYNVNSQKIEDLYADINNNRARYLRIRFAR
ncbi:DUF5005 domain-containing protein [Spirillospora sp. NBC_00431]